jgi:hypothetical protein
VLTLEIVMSKQTRMNSSQRRNIVLSHTSNIKPGQKVPAQMGDAAYRELRMKGQRTCSHMQAILDRRASFKVGTNNTVKG